MSQSRTFQKQAAADQKAYAANKPKNLTPSITYCSGTTTGSYRSPVWAVRDGADEHLSHASLRMGAQIARAV